MLPKKELHSSLQEELKPSLLDYLGKKTGLMQASGPWQGSKLVRQMPNNAINLQLASISF